ncbi:MAG: hypothetical protein O7E57_05695 [Gammaproteobacteria bacterium]|nr:hypothetical protein [Gammaproteobacteria bacterium]
MFSSRSANIKLNTLLIIGFVLSSATVLVAEADIKRTSSGKPDLSGTYNAATLTPLERPEKFGDNLYLTPEEADEIEKNEQTRIAERSAVSDPDREAPPDGGDG